jgi:hypothetical protein
MFGQTRASAGLKASAGVTKPAYAGWSFTIQSNWQATQVAFVWVAEGFRILLANLLSEAAPPSMGFPRGSACGRIGAAFRVQACRCRHKEHSP